MSTTIPRATVINYIPHRDHSNAQTVNAILRRLFQFLLSK